MSDTINLITPPEITLNFLSSDVTIEMPGASGDMVLEFSEPKVALNFIEQAVTLNFPADGGGTVTLNQILNLLSQVQKYESDQAAADDGVGFEEWYVAASNHDSVKGGTLTQNMIQ